MAKTLTKDSVLFAVKVRKWRKRGVYFSTRAGRSTYEKVRAVRGDIDRVQREVQRASRYAEIDGPDRLHDLERTLDRLGGL